MAPQPWSELERGVDRGPGCGVHEGYHRHARLTLLENDEPSWASNPKHLWLDGEMREFFLIGAFAQALGRSSQTIRLWGADRGPASAPVLDAPH